MQNTLILYDNVIEIKDILETMNKIVLNSKLHNINDQLNDIENYSNIILAISENSLNFYNKLKKYNIDFQNKKLIIAYIGSSNKEVINLIDEIKNITRKSYLYYYFVNLDYEKDENIINAGNNINKYIYTNKRSKNRSIK